MQIAPRPSVPSAAPTGIMRGEDVPERASPFHWPPAQPSPDSPGTHTSAPHSHAHRHVHHHHRPHSSAAIPRQPVSDPAPTASRRTSGMTSSFGSQPASVSLSSILQQSENGSVKMEGFAPQGSFSGYRPSEQFPSFQSGQRPLNSHSQHIYSRPINQQSHTEGRHHPKESDISSFGRSSDGGVISEASQTGLNPPISLRPVGRGYS